VDYDRHPDRVIIPAAVWFVFHIFGWEMCLLGGGMIAAFIILFIIEMRQDNGRIPYWEKIERKRSVL